MFTIFLTTMVCGLFRIRLFRRKSSAVSISKLFFKVSAADYAKMCERVVSMSFFKPDVVLDNMEKNKINSSQIKMMGSKIAQRELDRKNKQPKCLNTDFRKIGLKN